MELKNNMPKHNFRARLLTLALEWQRPQSAPRLPHRFHCSCSNQVDQSCPGYDLRELVKSFVGLVSITYVNLVLAGFEVEQNCVSIRPGCYLSTKRRFTIDSISSHRKRKLISCTVFCSDLNLRPGDKL